MCTPNGGDSFRKIWNSNSIPWKSDPDCASLMQNGWLVHQDPSFLCHAYTSQSVGCWSVQVNSNDDDGVLVGRWDGKYVDGTAPASWSKSLHCSLCQSSSYLASNLPIYQFQLVRFQFWTNISAPCVRFDMGSAGYSAECCAHVWTSTFIFNSKKFNSIWKALEWDKWLAG